MNGINHVAIRKEPNALNFKINFLEITNTLFTFARLNVLVGADVRACCPNDSDICLTGHKCIDL